MRSFAFFGTGECDPNKPLYQAGIVTAIALVWLLLIFAVVKTSKSKLKIYLKVIINISLVLSGMLASLAAIGAMLLGFSCSG